MLLDFFIIGFDSTEGEFIKCKNLWKRGLPEVLGGIRMKRGYAFTNFAASSPAISPDPIAKPFADPAA